MLFSRIYNAFCFKLCSYSKAQKYGLISSRLVPIIKEWFVGYMLMRQDTNDIDIHKAPLGQCTVHSPVIDLCLINISRSFFIGMSLNKRVRKIDRAEQPVNVIKHVHHHRILKSRKTKYK